MTGSTGEQRRNLISQRARLVAAILALQAVAAVFFIADVSRDLTWGGLTAHSGFEALVAIALVAGTGFGMLQLRHILRRMRRAEAAASVASGAFMEMIDGAFREWALTPAEAEVALFTLKGLDIEDIANLRRSARGTVRAQLAKVYSKAGVTSRGQLTSLFIEELLAAPLTQVGTETRDAKAARSAMPGQSISRNT